MHKAPRERMLARRLDVQTLFDTVAQVFGDFVHALKRGTRLFVGAMPRANATLSAVGAGALAVDAQRAWLFSSSRVPHAKEST